MWRRLRSSATTAVLAVVLAALVHVLACAHGPELGREAGSDSLPVAVVAAAVPEPAPASVPAVGEQGVRFADCTGVDDPSVLSRDVGAPPTPDLVAHAGAVGPEPRAVAGRAALGGGSPGDDDEQQRVRAVLGVWRT